MLLIINIATSIGGMVGAIVTSPLEVVKTRLQSSQYSVGSGNHWNIVHFVRYVETPQIVTAATLISSGAYRKKSDFAF